MDNDASCSAAPGDGKKCPVKCCFLAFLAVFVVSFGFDWLYHGVFLKDAYAAAAALWRPEAEMERYWPLCILLHAVAAAVVTCLFFMMCRCKTTSCGSSPCPMKKGVIFGLKIGLLLGVHHAGTYIFIPISQGLALSWLVGDILKWGLVGLVLGLICKMKDKKAGACG